MLTLAKSTLKRTYARLDTIRYHWHHAREARRLLYSIESQRGALGSRTKKICYEYAKEVYGNAKYAHWLYVYSALSGCFKEGWIPDNFYGRTVVPLINGNHGNISELKTLNNRILPSQKWPDKAYLVNGRIFDTNFCPVNQEDLKNILFSQDSKAIFKPNNSLQGRGIRVLDVDSFDVNSATSFGDGVFQSYIRQHPFFDTFYDKAVATIRITTTTDKNAEITIRASYLRFGTGSDNFVRSDSTVRIPVDPRSGELDEVGYTADWKTISCHPDTSQKFSGAVLPRYKDCALTAVDMHKRVPYCGCIGWDMIIDDQDNVQLMEYNAAHNGIKFSEATQGPCFSDLGWDRLRG